MIFGASHGERISYLSLYGAIVGLLCGALLIMEQVLMTTWGAQFDSASVRERGSITLSSCSDGPPCSALSLEK